MRKITLCCFLVFAVQAIAQTHPPRPSWNPDETTPTPTPSPRPTWSPGETPTPQPRPQPQPQPQPMPQPRPQPRPAPDTHIFRIGEEVIYKRENYVVAPSQSDGDMILLHRFEGDRYFFAVDYHTVALTKGCVRDSNYNSICVKDLTIASNNYYYRLIGIQFD